MADFLIAIGLVLVIEGLILAAGPAHAKRVITAILETPDGTLRAMGLGTAVVGLFLVWLVRG